MSAVPANERRNIWIPEALWRAVQQAAREVALARGERYTASEFVREALAEKLARER
jgi:hypothetical protein